VARRLLCPNTTRLHGQGVAHGRANLATYRKVARSRRDAGIGGTRRKHSAQDLIIPSRVCRPTIPFFRTRGRRASRLERNELAYPFLEGKLIGITGSNGKTTTTTLVHHILKERAIPTSCGNVGTAAHLLRGRV